MKVIGVVFLVVIVAHSVALSCCIHPDPAPAPPDWWPPAHYHLPIVRNGPRPEIGEAVTWETSTLYIPLVRN